MKNILTKKINFSLLKNLFQYNSNKFNKVINHPYTRLCRYQKPIGMLLLYWPITWGLAAASPIYPSPWLLSLFFAGSLTSRAAGCIINDYFDQDFDKKVERTKSRPFASNEITNKQAFFLLVGNLTVGLYVLTQLTLPALISTFLILPVAALYPLAKRYTKYPQFILGLAFNSGVIIGGLTVAPVLESLYYLLPIYCAGICWTLIYDTVYAFQDSKDDIKIGINSTALTWGENSFFYMKMLLGGSCISFISLSLLDHSMIYLIPFQTAAHFYLLSQLNKVNINSPSSCQTFFKKNNYFGIMILISLVLAKILNNFLSKKSKLQQQK